MDTGAAIPPCNPETVLLVVGVGWFTHQKGAPLAEAMSPVAMM